MLILRIILIIVAVIPIALLGISLVMKLVDEALKKSGKVKKK